MLAISHVPNHSHTLEFTFIQIEFKSNSLFTNPGIRSLVSLTQHSNLYINTDININHVGKSSLIKAIYRNQNPFRIVLLHNVRFAPLVEGRLNNRCFRSGLK